MFLLFKYTQRNLEQYLTAEFVSGQWPRRAGVNRYSSRKQTASSCASTFSCASSFYASVLAGRQRLSMLVKYKLKDALQNLSATRSFSIAIQGHPDATSRLPRRTDYADSLATRTPTLTDSQPEPQLWADIRIPSQ